MQVIYLDVSVAVSLTLTTVYFFICQFFPAATVLSHLREIEGFTRQRRCEWELGFRNTDVLVLMMRLEGRHQAVEPKGRPEQVFFRRQESVIVSWSLCSWV